MRRLATFSALFVTALFVADSSSVFAQSSTLFGGSNRNSATNRTQSSGASRSATGGSTTQATGTESSLSRIEQRVNQVGEGSGNTNTGFVGRSDNAGRFVGAQTQQERGTQGSSQNQNRNFGSSGGRSSFGRSSFGGNNFFNQLQRAGMFGNQFGRTSQKRGVFRPQQRIAFNYPKPTTAKVNSVLSQRLNRMSLRRPELSSVKFVLDEAGTVTLRGNVGSESAKRLAANMLRLQPGVRSVKNELTITQDGAGG